MKQNERHKQILPGASRATRAPPPVHQNSQGHPKTKTMQNAHFLFALGIIAILCLWCPQRRSGGVYIANGRLEKKRFNLLTFYVGDCWQSIAFQRKKKKDWAHGRGGGLCRFGGGQKSKQTKATHLLCSFSLRSKLLITDAQVPTVYPYHATPTICTAME